MTTYKYFNLSEITTADELKKAYRALCLTMHPDKGGNAEEFKAMKKEYDRINANFENERVKAAEAAEFERQRQEWEREEAERKAREAEEARKAAEAFAPIINEWRARLEQVPADGDYNDTKGRAKYAAAVKRNLKAVFSYYFPGVSVSVSMSRESYKEHVTITWTDGPTIYEVERLDIWDYFIARHWESDPYADYGSYEETKSTRAWRDAFGGILEACDFKREFSPAVQAATMAKAAEIIPDFAGKVWNDEINTTDAQSDALIDLFGIRSPYQWRAGMTDEEIREYYRLHAPFDELCSEIRRVIAPSHRVNWCNVYYQTITGIFARFYKVTDEDRAAAAKAEREAANAFNPQHGAVYNAIVKLLGKYQFVTNPTERRAERQPLSIYEAVEILAAGGSVAVASVDVREDGQSLWIYCLSNGGQKVQEKRAEKWMNAAGLVVATYRSNYGAVVITGVTAETLEAIRQDAADVEQQRQAWEARKADHTTDTTTERPQTEGAKGADEMTEADAVEMIEKAEQAGTITRETVGDWFTFSGRGTFGLKKAFRALGGLWDKIDKVWRVPVCYYNQEPAFVTSAEVETEPQQTTINPEGLEELRRAFEQIHETETDTTPADADPLADELAEALRRVDEIRARMAERDAQRKAEEERQAREAEHAAAVAAAQEEARQTAEARAKAYEAWQEAERMAQEAAARLSAAGAALHDATEADEQAAQHLADLMGEADEPTTPAEGVEGSGADSADTDTARRENVRRYFAEAAKKADELTENNEHNEAIYKLIAAFWACSHQYEQEAHRHIKTLCKIAEAHEKRGHILPDEINRRTCAAYRCAYLCIEEFGEDLARVLFGGWVDGLTNHPEATTEAA